MRAGFTVGASLLFALASVGCGSDDPGDEADAPTTSGPALVAAATLVPGDCVSGLALGTAERSTVESVRVTSCLGHHDVEVFADFALPDEGVYPGRALVIRAADDGCQDRLDALPGDHTGLGLIALWPTDDTWRAGDRHVTCAVYGLSGQPFEAPFLVGTTVAG